MAESAIDLYNLVKQRAMDKQSANPIASALLSFGGGVAGGFQEGQAQKKALEVERMKMAQKLQEMVFADQLGDENKAAEQSFQLQQQEREAERAERFRQENAVMDAQIREAEAAQKRIAEEEKRQHDLSMKLAELGDPSQVLTETGKAGTLIKSEKAPSDNRYQMVSRAAQTKIQTAADKEARKQSLDELDIKLKQQSIEDAETKRQEEANRKESASASIRESALSKLQAIEEVEKNMDFFGFQSVVPAFPGSSKSNWNANINKILADKIVDLMAEMKNVSKTGATGFGQLNEKELQVLKDSATVLKRDLNPKDAQRYLNDMKKILRKVANPTPGDATDGESTGNLDPLGLR